MPSINQTIVTNSIEQQETNDFGSNIRFFVMIPYIVGSDIKVVLDLFLKQLTPTRRNQIHIYLLPNASLFVSQHFIFKFKNNNVAKVEKTGDKNFLVKEKYGDDIVLKRKKLYEGRLLMYSKLSKEHEFLPIKNENYYLYTTDHIKLAKIRVPPPESTDENVKYQWLVKTVCSPKHENMIIAGNKLSSGNVIPWSQQPRQYYWLPCSADQKFADLRNTYKKTYEKDRNVVAKYSQLNINYLGLYEWLKDDNEGHQKKIPYGQFRQHLLDAAKKTMKKFHKDGKYVYMMPFDPDCKSLLVKGKTNLFDMYIDYIYRYHYPSIMTSGFTFTDNYSGLNRIFQLNRELQGIFQTYLPGSAYYSECNSIILYNPDFVNDKTFKFGLYGTEILPIIKYIASKNLPMVMLENAPLVTTVPARILNVMNGNAQNEPLSKYYYENILELSQIVISTHNFMSALISGLSIYIKTNSRQRKHLCELWNLHCPLIQAKLLKSKKSVDYTSRLQSICQRYKRLYSRDNADYVEKVASIREQCKKAMPTPKKQTNSSEMQTRDKLVGKCVEISRKCGQLCALHILQWMNTHDS